MDFAAEQQWPAADIEAGVPFDRLRGDAVPAGDGMQPRRKPPNFVRCPDLIGAQHQTPVQPKGTV